MNEQKIKREIKETNNINENYHQVLVKTDFPTNTGPKKLYTKVIDVKWGMVDKWIEANPTMQVVKIFDMVKI